jgi:hypothetical protein
MGRRKTAFTTVNNAVFAPIPNASVPIAVSAIPYHCLSLPRVYEVETTEALDEMS